MNHLRMKMKEHSAIAAFLVMLAFVAGDRLIGKIFGLLPEGVLFDTLSQIASMIWVVTLVGVSGCLHAYKKRGLFRTLFVAMPHVLLYSIFLLGTIAEYAFDPTTQWLSVGARLYGVLALFSIGFCEESIFRGAAVNLLASKGLKTRRDIFKVVGLSGFLFGALHMTNVFSGVNFLSAAFQSLSAIVGGFLFCAYYLRGGSLWGVMLIHALQDSMGLFDVLFIAGGDTTEALNGISLNVIPVTVVFLLLTLFLLRKSGCKKIIDRYAKEAA